ncbi:hypothetical protein [Actinoplanes sp. M2I2]|uniref:hypothetical protein n=1 Tax=Actinoplanes sp. M2I2 TaxID=1734444 RepID=UPI0020221D67|nr:hypothetical protein [Actinoplanes sp. M2I2]
MNRFARRGLIVLGTGTAVLGTALLGAGLGGAAVAGKGATGTDRVVAGTNWDNAPATGDGPAWEHVAAWAGPTVVPAGRGKPSATDGWAGPTIVLTGRGKPTTTDGWAGPTVVPAGWVGSPLWAGPTVLEA